MKKIIATLTILASLVLTYSLLPAQDTKIESDFIILSYTAYGSDIYVYKGGADEKPISCKKRDVSNCVVEMLSTYKAKGYKIASTTTAPSSLIHQDRNGLPAIYIFLEKE